MPDYYKCDCCGKLFVPHSSTIAKIKRGEQKTIACSVECASQLKRRTVITHCDNCGKEIHRKKSHYERQQKSGQHQFCSPECEHDFHHKETYEVRKCEICGNEFECPKISTQRFCSQQCQGKWQTTQVGDLNPRSTKIHQKCDWCGKDYLMKRYKLDSSENHFCSTECMHSWFNNVFAQTDEFKDRSSKRAAKIISDGLIPLVYTKPQLIVNDILDKLHVKYQNDYNAIYYAIDNYLSDYNLMIEVMGDYWHSNPNVFDYSSLNKIQLQRIPRDKAKHTFINSQYNIEILYLWEYDIINNPCLCQMLIKEYIGNAGKLDNYHSFNYHIDNQNRIELNDNIVFSYFDNFQFSNTQVS